MHEYWPIKMGAGLEQLECSPTSMMSIYWTQAGLHSGFWNIIWLLYPSCLPPSPWQHPPYTHTHMLYWLKQGVWIFTESRIRPMGLTNKFPIKVREAYFKIQTRSLFCVTIIWLLSGILITFIYGILFILQLLLCLSRKHNFYGSKEKPFDLITLLSTGSSKCFGLCALSLKVLLCWF